MRKWKKGLSVLLCIGMACTGSLCAMAEEEPFPDMVTDEYTDAVVDSVQESDSIGTVVADEDVPEPSEEVGTTTFPDYYPREMIYQISDEEVDEKVNAVIGAMTFSEKMELLGSSNNGVPRLGVPEVIEHDGPAGVSSSPYETTSLPNAQLLATTWDTESAYIYGQILGEEEMSVGANRHLGLQLDIQRNPFWHRVRDTLGEDYYFIGEMAVAETQGIQNAGTMAMAKHIGAYNTIGDKNLNVVVDEQTLNTAYFYPFEMAVKNADLSSIMTCYSMLNGIFAASNEYMQIEVARDMWNWKGAFVTDAGGNVEMSVGLGTDQEMAQNYNTEDNVRAYLDAGLITMDDIDLMCYHSLYALGVVGYLNLVEIDPDTGLAKDEPGRIEPIKLIDSYYEDVADGMYKEHSEEAQTIAEKGIVLLKNDDNTLPISADDEIALIGYPVTTLLSNVDMERSPGTTEYMETIEEAFYDELGEDANITTAEYDTVLGDLIPEEVLFTDAEGTENGLVRTYGIAVEDWIGSSSSTGYAGMRPEVSSLLGTYSDGTEDVVMEGYEVGEEYGIDFVIDFTTGNGSTQNPDDGTGTAFASGEAYTWKGYLKAPETGTYQIIIESIGGSASVLLNAKDGSSLSEDDSSTGLHATTGSVLGWNNITEDGLNYSSITVDLEAGEMYQIEVTMENNTLYYDQGLRLTWITPSKPDENREAALEAAANCDYVFYFAVHNASSNMFMMDNSMDSYDLTIQELDQILALQEVAKANGNKFIVVVYGRTCFSAEGDWTDGCDAIMMAYYPGQQGAQAIAEILTGEVNPSGKLQQTYPMTSEETVLTYNGEEGLIRTAGNHTEEYYTAYYDEGLNFGYRWYDDMDLDVLYAYGYGLSYTTFEYSDLSVTENASEGEEYGYDVTFTVTNTGDVTGTEIAQVYITGLDEEELPDDVQTFEKQLCGFSRIEDIEPGESRTVTIHVNQRSLSYWYTNGEIIEREDGTSDKFYVFPGERTVMVGAASDDLILMDTVEI